MKVGLIALDKELSLYARCLSQVPDTEWIGSYIQHEPGNGAAAPEGGWGAGNLPPVFTSPLMLIEKADAVLVAGKPETKFEYLSHTLRKGRAAWSAWPLSKTQTECRKLAELAHEARVPNHAARISHRAPVFRAALPYLSGSRSIRIALCRKEYRIGYVDSPENDLQFLQNYVFPYLDCALDVSGRDVKKVAVSSWAFGPMRHAQIRMFICFNSDVKLDFWIDRRAEHSACRMDFAGDNFSANIDFLKPRAAVRALNAATGKIEETVPSLGEARPVEEDLADFLQQAAQGLSGNFTFAEGAEVQALYEEIIKKLEIYA